MLKIRINIQSDSLLEALGMAYEYAEEGKVMGLEVVTVVNEFNDHQPDHPYKFALLLYDDDAILKADDISNQMRRVKELAQATMHKVAGSNPTDIDDIPF